MQACLPTALRNEKKRKETKQELALTKLTKEKERKKRLTSSDHRGITRKQSAAGRSGVRDMQGNGLEQETRKRKELNQRTEPTLNGNGGKLSLGAKRKKGSMGAT